MKTCIPSFSDDLEIRINFWDDLSEVTRREIVRKFVFDEGSVEQEELRQEIFDTLSTMGYTVSEK